MTSNNRTMTVVGIVSTALVLSLVSLFTRSEAPGSDSGLSLPSKTTLARDLDIRSVKSTDVSSETPHQHSSLQWSNSNSVSAANYSNADLALTATDRIELVSDGSWRVASTLQSGWNNVGFNDSAWNATVSPAPGLCGGVPTFCHTLPGILHQNIVWFDNVGKSMWNAQRSARIYARKTFVLDSVSNVLFGAIQTATDDDHKLYINGNLIVTDGNGVTGPIFQTTLRPYLRVGENVLAVEGIDRGGCEWMCVSARVDVSTLSISDIRVLQVVESENQSDGVPLIAHKPTLVRVYLDCSQETPCIADKATSSLTVSSPLGITTIPPVNAGTSVLIAPEDEQTDREGDLRKTLNFLIDPSLLTEGSTTLTASINDAAATMAESFEFVSAPVIRVAQVPIDYRPDASHGCEGAGVPDSRVRSWWYWAERVLPTHELQALQLPIMKWDKPLCDEDPDKEFENIQDLWEALEKWNRSRSWFTLSTPATYTFGWLPNESFGGGIAEDFAGDVAFGIAHPSDGPLIFAHELGHLLGRHHTNTVANIHEKGICRLRSLPPPSSHKGSDDQWRASVDIESDWPFPNSMLQQLGIDSIERRLKDETNTYDYMSYCGALEKKNVWTSPWTFEQIYNRLSTSSIAPEMVSNIVPQHYVHVSGTIRADDTANLRETWVFTSTAQPINPPLGSEYCIEVQGSMGALLSSYCFDADFMQYESGRTTEVDGFSVTLPYPDGVVRIVLKKNAQELANQDVSSNAPQVTVVSPNGGESIAATGPYTITWSSNDPDGDSLSYLVQYSANGADWMTVGTVASDVLLPVSFSEVPGSNAARIRVIATDGVNTSFDESDSGFQVETKPPQVFVLSPEEGIRIYPNELLWLQGYGYDFEDGEVSDETLDWSSDLDGDIESGNNILATLSRGRHMMTLSVPDSDGKTGTDEVSVLVGYDSGDCNGDESIDAGDLSALVLEIFDGDSNNYLAAPTGTFRGDPIGCDANNDDKIDAGDISCSSLMILEEASDCAQ